MTTLRVFFVASLSLLLACQGRATEEATPQATETASQSASNADQGIIPLEEVRASQSGSVAQTVATTEIVVTYDRPVARGRELFGGIVAYGEVWNPGANDATTISVSRPITINGSSLEAGSYSIWAIPDPDEWTVIFSRAADVYHTPYPGEEHDALRLMVAPRQGEHIETLAFYFPMVEKKDTELRLHWGETVIPFQITVP
jgi:hypothetical protein